MIDEPIIEVENEDDTEITEGAYISTHRILLYSCALLGLVVVIVIAATQ